MDGDEFFLGGVEYGSTVFDRRANELVGAGEAIGRWAQEQISILSSNKFSEPELDAAASSLSEITGDIRPLLVVETSEGRKGLDDVVDLLIKRKCGVFPFRVYSDEDITGG